MVKLAVVGILEYNDQVLVGKKIIKDGTSLAANGTYQAEASSRANPRKKRS